MTIASITRATNIGSADQEKARPVLQAAWDNLRATVDGCESIGGLVGDTESLVVIIWRDRAAFDAYARNRDATLTELNNDLRAAGVELASIEAPKLYEIEYWK